MGSSLATEQKMRKSRQLPCTTEQRKIYSGVMTENIERFSQQNSSQFKTKKISKQRRSSQKERSEQKKIHSGQLDDSLVIQQKDRYDFRQLSNSFVADQKMSDSGQVGNKSVTEQKRRDSRQLRRSLTRKQRINYSGRQYSLAPEQWRNYLGQLRDNLSPEVKMISDSHQLDGSLANEKKRNDSEIQKSDFKTKQENSEFQQQGHNQATQQNKNDSGQQSSNFSPVKNSSGPEQRSNGLTTKQGVVPENCNYSGQQSSNLATEQKKSNVSVQKTGRQAKQLMSKKLATLQNRNDSGQLIEEHFSNEQSKGNSENLSNSLTGEQKEGESQQPRDNLILEQKQNVSQEHGNNLTTEHKNNSEKLSSISVSEQEKCYSNEDTTLTFVDAEDDLDFLCEGYKSLRALMSCGHAVTPMSLTNWCRHLLDQGERKFICGQPDCDAEWSYDEVCKMALLTPREMEYFEKKLFCNVAKDLLDVKSCPSCRSSVVRSNLKNLSVKCPVCTAEKRRPYIFCWQCLREWKNPALSLDDCGNACCINQQLETLKTCPDITFKDVWGVNSCPSIRACPTCGFLLEHNKTNCKSIICTRCKVKFCFVCLSLYTECVKSSVPYGPCLRGTTPRQTSLPIWRRK